MDKIIKNIEDGIANGKIRALICEDCEAFDQIKEEGLHGTEIVFDDICMLNPFDDCDIDRDGPNELARNCPKRSELTAQKEPSGNEGVEIRKLLEDEAEGLYRSSERHRANEAMDAAAHDNAVREGVTRSLFLLNLKLGI